MKAYIVAKYEYIDGDLECYTETHILDVCLNKELAINLQKKYFLQFLNNETIPIPKDEFERYKKRIEKFNGRTEDYRDYWGIGVREFTIVEEQKG